MFPRMTKVGVALCVLLCLLVAPPLATWLEEVMRTPEDEVVLDLRGMHIPALYRTARKYADGSIDLTIHIPASVDVVQGLLDRQKQIKYNMSVRDSSRNNAAAAAAASAAGASAAEEDASGRSRKSRGYPEDDDDDDVNEDALRRTSYPVTLDTPFLLNSPELCMGVHPLHTLVIVHTATANFHRRYFIRETWAGKNLLRSRNQRVLFLLGLTPNVTVQRLLENEQHVYGDMVQGQFKDSYHNLTHKGVMAYRWIHQYCQHAKLILKVDDDMYINPFLFYDVYYPKYSRMNRTIACHVRPVNTSPIQRGRGKWMVPDFEFRGYKHYPMQYCNGYVVIMTPDIIKAMFSAAYTTPFFWVDDVYLYGMLPDKVGNVSYAKIQQNMTLDSRRGRKCYNVTKGCSLLACAVGKDPAVGNFMWQKTLRVIPPALKTDVNPVYLVT